MDYSTTELGIVEMLSVVVDCCSRTNEGLEAQVTSGDSVKYLDLLHSFVCNFSLF